MPIVNMSQDVLLNAVNRGAAAPLAVADLRKTITAIGTEVEEVAVMQQFICRRCGRLIERSEAQGVPVECPQCHADFRGAGAADCERRGENTVVRLNMVAARPDVFDPGGMARCIRGYLEIETGLREYPAAPPTIRVTVDPRLADEKSFRPCIACAVLRDVALDDEHIKILMNLQENLHWALGRDRKLASIGAYDLDTLHGREFRYDAVEPSELRFVPLGFDPTKPDTLLTPAEILQKHGTGMTYARLLAGFDQYPLLRDEKGVVLSMPPIINSEQTRVTAKTRNLFIDVTGPGQRIVDRALNVLVSGLRELLPQIRIEQVTVRTADGRERVTPDFTPSRMRISCREVAETIGVPLDRSAVGRLLERMGHRVAPDADADALLVDTPAYRNDIMHPIDLVEDAAVAYGFDNLPAELVPTFTVGQARQTEERSALARRALTGLGFHQVMTLGLTSEPAAFDKLRIPQDAKRHAALLAQAVRIENPISVEQTICRVMLLPGLLETFAINKQHDLPQNLFEVGDVCLVDSTAETGAREERRVAVAMIGTHVGYADIRAVIDSFAGEFARPVRYAPTSHPSFIPGRAAEIRDENDRPLGVAGELHPEVLENYGLRHAVAAMELNLEAMLGR